MKDEGWWMFNADIYSSNKIQFSIRKIISNNNNNMDIPDCCYSVVSDAVASMVMLHIRLVSHQLPVCEREPEHVCTAYHLQKVTCFEVISVGIEH